MSSLKSLNCQLSTTRSSRESNHHHHQPPLLIIGINEEGGEVSFSVLSRLVVGDSTRGSFEHVDKYYSLLHLYRAVSSDIRHDIKSPLVHRKHHTIDPEFDLIEWLNWNYHHSLTYDVLLRLASADDIYDAHDSSIETEYVENKFRYSKKLFSGYQNNALYILKYTPDLKFEVLR